MKLFSVPEGFFPKELVPKIPKDRKWQPEDLSACFFVPITERLKDIAYLMAVEKPNELMSEVQTAMYAFHAAMLQEVCRYFYEAEGRDFERFLNALIDALLTNDWKNKSIRRFTINFSRELGSTVRYALRKKRAAAKELRREKKVKKAKR